MFNSRLMKTMTPEALMDLANYLSYHSRYTELEVVLDELEKRYHINVLDFMED